MQRLLQHPAVHLGSLAALCLLGYGQGLGRYFVSEDFFVLRRFVASSLGEMTWSHLTGPLLEISFVKFYRPVSGFLVHVESLLWGTQPMGYLATHLAVHLLNVGLVYRLARIWSSGSRASAYGVALIFAVYPLHPNAVLFVAGFATLFSTTFLLAALVFYEMYRESRRGWALAGSLSCFALALGSYEQTVILPGLIAAREWLADGFEAKPGIDKQPARLWQRGVNTLRPVVAFGAILIIYFVVRQAALGQMVAGYEGYRERWLAAEVVKLGHGILEGLTYLIYPDYSRDLWSAIVPSVGLLLLLASVWAYRRGGNMASFWFLGMTWILASQAPFSFAKVTPGNGRYVYLTSIGLGLLVVAVARGLAPRLVLLHRRLNQGLVVATLAGALGVAYLVALVDNTSVYAEAGQTTRALQSRLVEVRQPGSEQMFVTGYPDFSRNSLNTTIAQVFHWGLSDALAPPFVEPGPKVYPLPRRLTDAELLPILERPDLGPTWRWSPTSGSLTRVIPGTESNLARIATRSTGADEWQFQATQDKHRLVLLTRGGGSVSVVDEIANDDGWTAVRPPAAVVQSMRHLYGGEAYVWVEARKRGRLTAVSPLHRLAAD